MKLKFHVYIIEEESLFDQKKIILVKVQNPDTYNGFDDLEDAEEWIAGNGERQIEYTILPTYRHP